MWSDACKQLDLPVLSPLTYQAVSQQLYVDIITKFYSTTITDSTTEVPELTVDEENVLRYVAGYIPYKLLKKYEQRCDEEYMETVECLHSMAVTGDESSLMEYTRKWCLQIDRGGLFEVNDSAYLLFREIEIGVREKLIASFSTSACDEEKRKDAITNAVAASDNVQFFWTLLSVDISNEKTAIAVLREMIQLWITIRGFSIAKAWLEKYLPDKKTKEKGIRKELKKTTPPSNCS